MSTATISPLRKLGVLLLGSVMLAASGGIGYAIATVNHSDAALTVHETPAKIATAAPIAVGPDAATTKVDIWEDITCAQCLNFETNGNGDIIKQAAWNGKLQVRYHLLTYVGDRLDASRRAVNAAACAYDQNPASFFNFIGWAVKNTATSNETGYTPELIAGAAPTLNLGDVARFNACVKNLSFASYAESVNNSAKPEQEQGQPVVYINGTQLTDLSPANVKRALGL
jgi:protein-disulfide isomerase